MSSKERNRFINLITNIMATTHIGTSVPKDKRIKHYIFDYLPTNDGYEIGWLHEKGDTEISDPDSELFYDKYGMMDIARELIMEGHDFTNYWLDDEDIWAWEEERDEQNADD